jgi:putative FmdB family regulatory protein
VPTYDYQCRSCGTITEVIHSMLEDGPSTCERCGGELRRVLYPAGIIFKGPGFYSTDSRSGSSKAVTGSAPSTTSTAGDASSSSSTDGTSGGAASGGKDAAGSKKSPSSAAGDAA